MIHRAKRDAAHIVEQEHPCRCQQFHGPMIVAHVVVGVGVNKNEIKRSCQPPTTTCATIIGPWNCWHRQGCSCSTICAASHLARWIIHAILPLEPLWNSTGPSLTIRVSSPPLRLSVMASWSSPWRLTSRRSLTFPYSES